MTCRLHGNLRALQLLVPEDSVVVTRHSGGKKLARDPRLRGSVGRHVKRVPEARKRVCAKVNTALKIFVLQDEYLRKLALLTIKGKG